MKVKTRDGGDGVLQSADVENLRAGLRGDVLLPGDAAYETSRTIWNGMIDRRPGLVVRCLGSADVAASVRFAREHDILLSIKGGGHNIAGLAVADGAMMLDMSRMRGVWVEPEASLAHVQAGCVLGDVDRETQLHGLAAPLGFVSLTGVTGLTLGGGLGYLTRKYGWTSDNVTGISLVTAEGEPVRASESENEDLFWALRGGGGNFGVVTGIDYRVYPVGPDVVGGLVAWPAGDAEGVLEFYRALAAEAPRELTLVALMRMAPPAPWLPEDVHGKPIVAVLACYSGDPTDGEKLVAPIKSFGKPVGDVLVRRPYTQVQGLLDATQPTGRRYYWKSEYLPSIEPGICKDVIRYAAAMPSPHSALILFQLDGALSELPEEHSAVGNRDARYVLNVAGSWERAEDDEANIGWAREAWGAMRGYSTGGTYINFQTSDEGTERLEAAFRGNLSRLTSVKAHWDPENVFCTNRNIVPA